MKRDHPGLEPELEAFLEHRPIERRAPPEIRAHQRLLREFLEYHLSDSRPLRAFAAWETGHWDAA